VSAGRGALVNASLSLAVTVLLLLGLEGVGRLYEWRYPPPDVAGYIWDWQVEWQGDFPIATASRRPFPVEALNGDGFRDRWHSPEKADLEPRVVCLGDSVTFGAEIQAEEAYPQVLEARLRGVGRRVEVMNAGMPGWSTRQERIAYSRILRRYRPDRVVLGVCLNDIPELQNNLSRPPGWLGWLYRRSSFVRAVVGARGREIARVEELFRPGRSARNDHALGLFFEEVRALRRDVETDGARLSVVVFPFRFQVEGAPPAPVVQRAILDHCAREGLACLDLLPTLAPLGGAAFVDYDHLSPRGVDAAVDAILHADLLALPRVTGDAAERAAYIDSLVREKDHALRGSEVDARLRSDDSAGVRLAALEAIVALRGPEAAASLLGRLDDPSQAVRWRAAQALADLPLRAPAVPVLTRSLSSLDAYVRRFAVWKLGEMGVDALPSVDAIVALLRDDGATEACGASLTLGRLHAVTALPALLDELRSGRRDRRVEAAQGLGLLGRPAVTAVPQLMAVLGDYDPDLRAAAVEALGQMEFTQAQLRAAVVRRIDDEDWRVREAAATALGRRHLAGPVSVRALAGALGDDRVEVRARAAASLGAPGNAGPSAVAALVRALGDAARPVRAEAARSLGALGPLARAARPALKKVSEADRAPQVRHEAARALEATAGGEVGER
jgi:HEAT repeat protein